MFVRSDCASLTSPIAEFLRRISNLTRLYGDARHPDDCDVDLV
jgi:hypothetical protein